VTPAAALALAATIHIKPDPDYHGGLGSVTFVGHHVTPDPVSEGN
jgi:hypothetical protein